MLKVSISILIFAFASASYAAGADEACRLRASATEGIEATTLAILNPDGRLCRYIADVQAGRTPTINPVCAVFPELWPNGSPLWLNRLRTQPQTLEKGSRQYVNPTRAQMLARGYAYAGATDEERLTREFRGVIEPFTQQCCDENQSCTTALSSLRFEFCSDPNATSDTSPDACSSSDEAYYTQSDDERLNTAYMLSSTVRNQVASLESNDRTNALRARLRPNQINPGTIVMGRYLAPGETSFNSDIILHELGHACQYVKAQVYAQENNSDAFAGFTSGNNRASRCAASDAMISAAFAELSPSPNEMPGFASCMIDALKAENTPGDLGYSERNCPRVKMVEAWADSFRFLNTAGYVYNVYDMCRQDTDPQHFSAYKTLECAIKNDPNIQSEISADLNCQPRTPARARPQTRARARRR